MSRSYRSYLKNLGSIHLYAWWFLQVVIKFKRPFEFIHHYLTKKPLALVETRDGMRINLSGHQYDLITVFVIFIRKDYGHIRQGAVILDVGSNIGVFALYCAHEGATRVVAVEPNKLAFDCLELNIQSNSLATSINALHRASGAKNGAVVYIPTISSPMNRTGGEGDPVSVISLRVLCEMCGEVELLKMDCEGAEYETLYADPEVLRLVKEIRMEFHDGRQVELRRFLEANGFHITKFHMDGPTWGVLWAKRMV